MNKLNDFLKKYEHILPVEAKNELSFIAEEYYYLKQIFNYSDWTISLVDFDGNYLILNPKMQSIVGDVVGKKIGSLSKNNKLIDMMNFLKENPHKNQTFDIIDSFINDTHKTFLLQMTKIQDKFLIMGSEITELQELKKQQEFNDRMIMLGEMSSFIVHEINNPLNSISLSAEVINLVSNGNKKVEEQTNQIHNMIDTVSKIISTLKSFSRKNDNQIECLNFEKIVNQAELVLMPKLKKNQISLIKELDNSSINGSEIEFLQVLVNLIGNSIDAISERNDKWIKVIWKNGELQVIDSGCGIDEKVVSRLFEKFHTTKGKNGNGIGLYLSKEMLNKNGYDLQYKLIDNHTGFCWNKKAA